jgi:hypothetical protein
MPGQKKEIRSPPSNSLEASKMIDRLREEAGHSIAGYDVIKNANSDVNSTTTRSTKTQPMKRSFE